MKAETFESPATQVTQHKIHKVKQVTVTELMEMRERERGGKGLHANFQLQGNTN